MAVALYVCILFCLHCIGVNAAVFLRASGDQQVANSTSNMVLLSSLEWKGPPRFAKDCAERLPMTTILYSSVFSIILFSLLIESVNADQMTCESISKKKKCKNASDQGCGWDNGNCLYTPPEDQAANCAAFSKKGKCKKGGCAWDKKAAPQCQPTGANQAAIDGMNDNALMDRLCKTDQHVKDGVCVDCMAGMANAPGDDPGTADAPGVNTYCAEAKINNINEGNGNWNWNWEWEWDPTESPSGVAKRRLHGAEVVNIRSLRKAEESADIQQI